MSASLPAPEPGWFQDPAGNHESRWWDGEAWTARVADAGRTSPDPLTEQYPAPGAAADPEPTEQSPNDGADGTPAASTEATAEEGADPAEAETDAPKPKRTRSAAKNAKPKWEQNALASVRTALQSFRKPLHDLLKRDANEGDTRLLITDFLCDALGYDKFNDLTTEFMVVRGEFADYGLRIDKQLVAFVEVKRVAQKLKQQHLRQVETYAVKGGVEWCFLTNGQVWQAYHVSVAQGEKAVTTLVFEVDLFDDASVEENAALLFHLHHDALKRSTIAAVWQQQAAIDPRVLVQLLLSEPVIDALRKEVRRGSGYNPAPEDLVSALRGAVIPAPLL